MTDARALARREDEKLDLWNSIPFFAIHAVAIVAPFFVTFSWKLVGLAVLLYYGRMAGTTIGYHRYASHRGFKTNRVFQFVLAFWAQTSAQKGMLWWAAHHRNHHKYSDQPEDVHSPQRGFFWSHLGWILCQRYVATGEIKDLSRYPELRFLNRFHILPPFLLATALFFIGGWSWLVWGFFVSTVLLWHG
ncbi:MAG TPA: fatty acid desaturase, partial [Myxococcales bacterium]|nr:fatty acid desaturase [Myxococcales bacterium]